MILIPPENKNKTIHFRGWGLEIIQHIADGLTSRKIADKLFISPHTVQTHRKNIMRKLKVNSVSELVVYAMEAGLVEGQAG